MGLKFEENMMSGKYSQTEYNKPESAVNKCEEEEEKVYTYDEAIDLTGDGWYNLSLLVVLVLVLQGMALDMFGFADVVAGARCDLQLTHDQTTFLLSVPLMGSIVSAYFHGYLSDMYGRKKCISFALIGSFLLATLSAFSPNFIVLAVLKFFSSSISSGIQSMSYTLMGESCCTRTKESFVIILTSGLMCCFAVFTAHAYLVLGLNFSYDLGFIIFKPWRLLILTLAMALGSSAVFIHFFYESPKYLISAGRIPEAVEILRKIKKRNGVPGIYPVKKIILLDPCPTRPKEVPFVRSLWEQFAPLFKPPLLQKTLLLFYIIAVIYSLNNGFYIWIPVIFSTFFDEPALDSKNVTEDFCGLINSQSHKDSDDCTSIVSLETLVMSIIQGVVFFILNFHAAKITHRKKALIILLSLVATVSCIAMLFTTDKITTIIFFFGVQMNCIAMGMTFCYMIELYPTRYRGMITSLGVMVARGSALVGVNLVGAFMFTHCTASLYGWGAYSFSGALMALLLPPDLPKKS